MANIYDQLFIWAKNDGTLLNSHFKKKKKKKKESGRVPVGYRRVGLNGYPLKQTERGSKRVFWDGSLNGAGRVVAGRVETQPIAILTIKYPLLLKISNFL